MNELKLTNDFVFKKVFGKQGNESILKNLLEAILKIKIEIAKEMLAKKFDISTIVEIIKLTKEEVEELKEKN